jgi:TonB family protein
MNSKNLAVVVSLCFHLLLGVAAYLYQVELPQNKQQELIEVLQFGIQSPANNQEILEPATAAATQKSYAKGKSGNKIPQKVKLPPAAASQQQNLYSPQFRDIAPGIADNRADIGNVEQPIESNIAAKGKVRNLPEKPVLGDQSDFLNSLSERLTGGDSASPYVLEGEITSRTILHKEIPAYPPEVQKNARIKIKFQVLANGEVANVVLVKKADPILDRISVDAIKKWRFNALNQPVKQTGFITFIFQIK